MTEVIEDKQADLMEPRIGDYAEIEKTLPYNYRSLLTLRETQQAITALKRFIADGLCRELNLTMVEVPLIVDAASGVNDMLDRDGSHVPVSFHISNDREKNPIDAQVVQAATKWKRTALRQFGCLPGEGICTDMRAIRKEAFLDHDHSAYVDQWEWERALTADQRTLATLEMLVRKVWTVIVEAEARAFELFPKLDEHRHPRLPDEPVFLHTEDVLEMYPDMTRKQRENALLQKYPAVFVIGIGCPLADGFPHAMRAADCDDWITDTHSETGKATHGLNGDILVWNPVTRRRLQLMTVGIRVTKDTLRRQLEMSGQLEFLDFPYHRAILNDELPLSIGGGLSQSRLLMLLLRKAHLGEVSVGVWPKILKEICAKRNIFVLD